VELSSVTRTQSRTLEMQRICERTCEVRLSAPVGQEPGLESAQMPCPQASDQMHSQNFALTEFSDVGERKEGSKLQCPDPSR
jgi:hypothetical protein